ncbi:unnamed protein product [Didymodactylos carnosus]|uniref:Tubulin-tyrosine ligase n=1 Tax=Didymodactylos carnosus TaxID=1234261 RepID=A0A813UVE2_9BILA|nr:unnamed protein product [Didymodactylos carnosus]CAF0828870.1 unnamed protein product [Didymodactylos carnosus]CAF3583573.1 unnamed protein product [Didymodactylos carnosus]CAF3615873.1 unnamed protein product [Didymodactylos carnosus]
MCQALLRYKTLFEITKPNSKTVQLIQHKLLEELKNGLSTQEQVLFLLEYEDIDFDLFYYLISSKYTKKNTKIMTNSFCIRKGLLRKANFSTFVQRLVAKRPESPLIKHYPETFVLDLSHPDYLDEALNEAYELRDVLQQNALLLEDESVTSKTNEEPKLLILKASLIDKGQELFIFRTQNELEDFFNEKMNDDDENEITNLREWVIQRYIENPLLLCGGRKFHLRVYIVVDENLKVYIYDGILALFASKSYNLTMSTLSDRLVHITNTCVQMSDDEKTMDEHMLVKEFFKLDEDLNHQKIYEQIKLIVKEIFGGLHHEISLFQPIQNCFEIYGFDFIIDRNLTVYFLEANAYPDFKQTGADLSVIIEELFMNIVNKIILAFNDN